MRYLSVAAVAVAAAGLLLIGSPAQAWDNGTSLRTGDVFCTDQTRSDIGARFAGHVAGGSATATIRAAATAGGAETVVWSQTVAGIDFNKYVYLAPGTHYRGCVTITAHTANTWARSFISGLGATAVGDIGPHLANLGPGGRACGDFGTGPVRLTGAASAAVTWYINGSDLDYAFAGTVFSTGGGTVDTGFVPGPDLTLLELCVHNSSARPVSVAYELSAA
ncbi:hypothetical protein [Actinophytocola sp.]|uniref:hypothetical protein n=1 Tax=Actinophytocola sp. TaxID=1872138 RepID=UPI002D7E3446|nr:hypothetical protein [Actinophytocola sp.]HET9140836.1 hypothetical protein [Actinophytocola sp.]